MRTRCPDGAIGRVVREVDRRGRAIVLAGRVDRRRVAEAAQVLVDRARIEERRAAGAPAADLGAQVGVRIGADHPLGHRLGLDQEEPVVVRGRERAVGLLVHGERRRDVEHRDAFDRLGMVEREPVRDAPAAVVADEREARVAERAHDRDHVGRHRALRVGRVQGIGRGLRRVAVAAQVGADDGAPARERGRDLVPHRVRLRIAVQQQERRAAARRRRRRSPRPRRRRDGLRIRETVRRPHRSCHHPQARRSRAFAPPLEGAMSGSGSGVRREQGPRSHANGDATARASTPVGRPGVVRLSQTAHGGRRPVTAHGAALPVVARWRARQIHGASGAACFHSPRRALRASSSRATSAGSAV